jgi:hypothetical protein
MIRLASALGRLDPAQGRRRDNRNREVSMLKPAVVLALALGALGALLAGPGPAAAQPAPAAPLPCVAAGDLNFVCGLVNVEDFLPVGGGRWLVGSSYKAGSAGLYLIDTMTKTARPVALSFAAKPDPIYAGCVAPDLKGLSTHGLDVIRGPGATATVYAVNHGGRDSIEVFRLNAARDSAEWIGCVVMPPGANPNSIAALPQTGGFVVTKFLDTVAKQGIGDIMARKITGTVFAWTPGQGFSEVPGTRFSGDNGLVVSPDGRWLYINAYGTKEIWRVPLNGQGERKSVAVDFYPDNLRWAPDGQLFVTGQFLNPQNIAPPHGWAAVRLDPQAMTVAPLVKEPGRPQFDDATSTVQIGDTLWFGAFRGDRVAYRPAP